MSERQIVEQLEKRLQGNPKSLLFARLADLYIADKKLNEAIELCQEGIRYNPGYITGHFILAKAYALKKDYEKAEACLKKVLSFDREYLSAHKVLGDLMLKMGFENKAGQHFREILAIDPLDLKTLRTLESLGETENFESDLEPTADAGQEPMEGEWMPEEPAEKWAEPIREVFSVPEEQDLSAAGQEEEPRIRTDEPGLSDSDRVPEPVAAPGENAAHESTEPDWIETLGETTAAGGTVRKESPGQPAEEEPAISPFPDFFGIVDDERPTLQQRQAESDSAEQLASRLVEIDEAGARDTGGKEPPAAESPGGWFVGSGKNGDAFPQEPEKSQSPAPGQALDSFPKPEPQVPAESITGWVSEQKTPAKIESPPPPAAAQETQPDTVQAAAEPQYETLQPEILETLNRQPETLPPIGRKKAVKPEEKPDRQEEKTGFKPAEKAALPPQPAAAETGREKSSAKPLIVTPTLGEIYAAQGQFQKALQIFQTLLEQNPGEIRYQNKIQELKKKLQQS
jgi:tetratricopeptide (TPR) repeat protein